MLVLGNCPLVRTQGSGYVTLGYVDGLRERGWRVDAVGPETLDPWPALGRARSLRLAAGMLRHGEQAWLLDGPRSPLLYEGVRALLLDEGRRARIAAAGHARVQSLRWPAAVATLAAHYERWLGELRGGA